MKTTFLTLILVVLLTILTCGQPNTTTTVEVGLIGTQPQKTYLFFSELTIDNTQPTVLEDGMDYLDPNVSSYITTLTNFHVVGDTVFGEFVISDLEIPQYVNGGLVQVNNITNKYSAMTTTGWSVVTDTIEPNEVEFFMRKKNK